MYRRLDPLPPPPLGAYVLNGRPLLSTKPGLLPRSVRSLQHVKWRFESETHDYSVLIIIQVLDLTHHQKSTMLSYKYLPRPAGWTINPSRLELPLSYFESKLIPEVSWRVVRRLIGQTSAISTLSLSLTRSRGEYLRVVGIHSD